jgi:hypothetical protein
MFAAMTASTINLIAILIVALHRVRSGLTPQPERNRAVGKDG